MNREILVIGGSAGGVEAITSLLRQLRADLRVAVFVVCHLLPDAKSHLVDALNTAGPLPAKTPADGEAIKHGVVYVAPPDRHLLVKEGYVRTTRGPRENRWRPAIDPLFRSAAVAYGNRVIGIVLTGMLDDGTAGLIAIKRCGGLTMVQDPEEAPYPDMPLTALTNVEIDHKLMIADMGPVLQCLLTESVPADGHAPSDLAIEARIAETGFSSAAITEDLGVLTPLSCPECDGPLWQREEAGDLMRFRCRVGHAYSARSLLSAGDEALEASVWAAIRMFDQRANILTAMVEKDRAAGRIRMVEHHESLANEARTHANALRRVLMSENKNPARAS